MEKHMIDTMYVYEGNKTHRYIKIYLVLISVSRNLRFFASVHLLDLQGLIHDLTKASGTLGETISDPYLLWYRRHSMNVNEKKKIARTAEINQGKCRTLRT